MKILRFSFEIKRKNSVREPKIGQPLVYFFLAKGFPSLWLKYTSRLHGAHCMPSCLLDLIERGVFRESYKKSCVVQTVDMYEVDPNHPVVFAYISQNQLSQESIHPNHLPCLPNITAKIRGERTNQFPLISVEIPATHLAEPLNISGVHQHSVLGSPFPWEIRGMELHCSKPLWETILPLC